MWYTQGLRIIFPLYSSITERLLYVMIKVNRKTILIRRWWLFFRLTSIILKLVRRDDEQRIISQSSKLPNGTHGIYGQIKEQEVWTVFPNMSILLFYKRSSWRKTNLLPISEWIFSVLANWKNVCTFSLWKRKEWLSIQLHSYSIYLLVIK